MLFIVLAFFACSKNDPQTDRSPDYYFEFKVNETKLEYPMQKAQINLTGTLSYDGKTGHHTIHVAGMKDLHQPLKNTLSFIMVDQTGFSTRVNYCNIPGAGASFPSFMFTMGYYDANGQLYSAAGAGDQDMFDLYEPAFIEFTEITEAYIVGKFSGTLRWYESSGGTNVLKGTVVISNGQFKVPRY